MFGMILVVAGLLPRPEPPVCLDLKLHDADVREVASLLSLPAFLKTKLAGKVGLVELHVRGTRFDVVATGWRVPGDPISRLEATGDWRTKKAQVKMWALGGLVEYEGRFALP
jgi:hypothetical protein